jgi:hypothetical protein
MYGRFCTCSGSTNGPASSTRMRRLRAASAMNRCSATTQPNVPPPTMIVSKARVRPPTTCPALSSASCKLLQRKRPILSSVKLVDSEASNGAMCRSPRAVFRPDRHYPCPQAMRSPAASWITSSSHNWSGCHGLDPFSSRTLIALRTKHGLMPRGAVIASWEDASVTAPSGSCSVQRIAARFAVPTEPSGLDNLGVTNSKDSPSIAQQRSTIIREMVRQFIDGGREADHRTFLYWLRPAAMRLPSFTGQATSPIGGAPHLQRFASAMLRGTPQRLL